MLRQPRFLVLFSILLLFINIALYGQDNSSDLLSFTPLNARKEASSFVTLIGLAPLDLLREFAYLNNIAYLDTDTDVQLREKIIKSFLDISPVIEQINSSESIPRRSIFGQTGDVVLYHADIVQRYEIEEADEEVLFIYGNVSLKLYDNMISSDTVVYSTKTDEVFGSGNVILKSSSSIMEGSWFLINKKNNVGLLYNGQTLFQSFIVEGNVLKFKEDVFIIEDAKISFSKLSPPAHSLTTQRTLLWDEKKIMVYNTIYSIGEQPIVWFPFFIQNFFGTGIITSFGQSIREGMFVQNRKTFSTGDLDNTIRFDLYQKLGLLVGDELRYDSDDNTISFDAMTALGRKYYLLEDISSIYYSGSYYGNYFLPNASTEYAFRYRFDYDQSLVVHKNDFMTTKVSGSLILASDLYFKSDFYNQRAGIDIFELLTSTISGVEDIGDQDAEAYMNNGINIENSGKNHSVSFRSDWNLEAVRNLSVQNNINFDYEKPVTTSIVLPAISASYNDMIGGPDDYYFHGANINYGISTRYEHTINYVPIEGISFDDNPNLKDELDNVLSERHVIGVSGNMSRSFTNSFLSFTPSVGVNYNQQISENPTAEEKLFDKQATYTSLDNKNSLSFFIPRDVFPEEMYEYFEPTFSFNNSYNISYKFKDEYEDFDTYGGFGENNITSSLSIGGTGYGVFFIPKLNFSLRNTTSTGYDLRPTYDAFDKSYSLEDTKARILNTYTSSSFELKYNDSYVSYNIDYDILKTNITANSIKTFLYLPIPLKDAVAFIFSPIDKKNYINKYLTSFDLFLSYSYEHHFETYLFNKMYFKFGINFSINELWNFQFAINSANNRAYRYVKSYAEEQGVEYVNFFEDLGNSFNFADQKKLSSSLFKLESIEATLWHDLDGWDMSISFAVKPESLPSDLTSGSVKGYYWNKEFWIEFRLVEFSGIGFPKIEPNLNQSVDSLRDAIE